MDVLSWQRVVVTDDSITGPLRRTATFWEPAVNDRLLSELVDANFVSVIESPPTVDHFDALRRITGEVTGPHVHVPRFERSALDKLLGRQGIPWAVSGPAFEDGRTCLLTCPCGDLECGAVSARIDVAGDTVTWVDVSLQWWGVPHDPRGAVLSATFDRDHYLTVLEDLTDDLRATL